MPRKEKAKSERMLNYLQMQHEAAENDQQKIGVKEPLDEKIKFKPNCRSKSLDVETLFKIFIIIGIILIVYQSSFVLKFITGFVGEANVSDIFGTGTACITEETETCY